MLKIKDNVDLKELENYGYYKTNYDGEEGYLKTVPIFCGNDEIFVRKDKTFLIVNDAYYFIGGEEQKKYIQDLIKADLVEEVSLDSGDFIEKTIEKLEN